MGGGQDHFLFNYLLWAPLAAPKTGLSLPRPCAPSPSPTRPGRGLRRPRPSGGSPLLSLRLSSAPAAPRRELHPPS